MASDEIQHEPEATNEDFIDENPDGHGEHQGNGCDTSKVVLKKLQEMGHLILLQIHNQTQKTAKQFFEHQNQE